jgi:uncharacterized surface protein with fasciclin (FAS1) repeats
MTKHIKNLISIVGISTIAFTGLVSSTGVSAQTAVTDAPTMDIVDTAVANGNFKSLATALTKADLVNTLKGPGPFTVFAPTDAAFAKLPSDVLNSLLNDPAKKADLTSILTYHVVSGKVPASEVVKLSSAKTVQGSDVMISVRNGEVFLNDNVKVVTTDIQASNGIIHVIDTVLTVPSTTEAMTTAPSDNTGLIRTGGESLTNIVISFSSLSLLAGMAYMSLKKNSEENLN